MIADERKKFFEEESPKIIQAYIDEQKRKEQIEKMENVDMYEEQETVIDDEYSNQNYEIDALEIENDDQQSNNQYDQNASNEESATEILHFDINPDDNQLTKSENEIKFVLNKTQTDQVTYSILNIEQQDKYLESHKMETEEIIDDQSNDVDETSQEYEVDNTTKPSIKLSDFEYESVFQAVKETVAVQCSNKTQDDLKFRIVSREGNLTQVEVELEDESLLVLEIELEKEVKKKVCLKKF